MIVKRKRHQRKHFYSAFVLGKVQTEQMKGRDKTMLQKKTEYWQEVNDK